MNLFTPTVFDSDPAITPPSVTWTFSVAVVDGDVSQVEHRAPETCAATFGTNPHKGFTSQRCPPVHAVNEAPKIEGNHGTPCGTKESTGPEPGTPPLRTNQSIEMPENPAKQGFSSMISNNQSADTKETQNDKAAPKTPRKARRKPFTYLDHGNYRLPIYRRGYHGRENNKPAYVLAFKNAATGKPDQISRVDLEELKTEGMLLIANGFVIANRGSASPQLTLEAAERYQALKRAASKAESTPESLVREALECREILGKNDPLVAARYYRDAIVGGFRPTRVGVVVQQFFVHNEQLEAGKTYFTQMRYLLPHFARAFRGRYFHDISSAEIESFLLDRGLKPESLRAYLGLIRTMSSFAQMRGYIPQQLKPQASFVKLKRRQRNGVVIIRPDQLRHLLDKVFNLNLLLYQVLGAFAGLRTCEIRRLRWEHVLEESIHIPPAVAKSGTAERYVPIVPVLAAWLKPLRTEEGPVVTSQALCGQLGVFLAAVGAKAARNWLRHAFGSFRVALTQNKEATICEMGNSHFVFHSHYFTAQHRTLAEEYFAIFPPADWDTRWKEILAERKSTHIKQLRNSAKQKTDHQEMPSHPTTT